MNETFDTPPNAYELLARALVAKRLARLARDPLSFGKRVVWNHDVDGSETAIVICATCSPEDAVGECEDTSRYHLTVPADLGRPVPCAVCGVSIRFELSEASVTSVMDWVRRLVVEKATVPDTFWLYIDALLLAHARKKRVRDSDPLRYELFLNAVLDLDLLQP